MPSQILNGKTIADFLGVTSAVYDSGAAEADLQILSVAGGLGSWRGGKVGAIVNYITKGPSPRATCSWSAAIPPATSKC